MLKTGGNASACPDFGVLASDEAQAAVRIGVRLDDRPDGQSNQGRQTGPT
tara:strand:- start:25915 stop:26064 length:150 start_codon:yes stop_codon:yes gene_type:complete